MPATDSDPIADDDLTWTLQPGDAVRRTELHRIYGGSNYGGMAPSTTTPNVLLFSVDDLRLPAAFSARQLDDAVTSSEATIDEVPIEAQHTERTIVNPSHEPHTAERREQALVLRYEQHLLARGSAVARQRIQPP